MNTKALCKDKMPLVNTMHNYTVSDKKSGLEADGVFELTPVHLYEDTFLKPFPNLLKRAVDDQLLDISVYETSADMLSRMCVCVKIYRFTKISR